MAPMAIALLAIAAGALSYALAGAPSARVKRRAASERGLARRRGSEDRPCNAPPARLSERIMPLKAVPGARLARESSTARASPCARRRGAPRNSRCRPRRRCAWPGWGSPSGRAPCSRSWRSQAPRSVAGRRRLADSAGKSRADDVAKNLPSALELMVVSVSAGLVLERGMKDVASDSAFGPVAEEFARCEAEISRLGVPRTRRRGDARQVWLPADELFLRRGHRRHREGHLDRRCARGPGRHRAQGALRHAGRRGGQSSTTSSRWSASCSSCPRRSCCSWRRA